MVLAGGMFPSALRPRPSPGTQRRPTDPGPGPGGALSPLPEGSNSRQEGEGHSSPQEATWAQSQKPLRAASASGNPGGAAAPGSREGGFGGRGRPGPQQAQSLLLKPWFHREKMRAAGPSAHPRPQGRPGAPGLGPNRVPRGPGGELARRQGGAPGPGPLPGSAWCARSGRAEGGKAKPGRGAGSRRTADSSSHRRVESPAGAAAPRGGLWPLQPASGAPSRPAGTPSLGPRSRRPARGGTPTGCPQGSQLKAVWGSLWGFLHFLVERSICKIKSWRGRSLSLSLSQHI